MNTVLFTCGMLRSAYGLVTQWGIQVVNSLDFLSYNDVVDVQLIKDSGAGGAVWDPLSVAPPRGL